MLDPPARIDRAVKTAKHLRLLLAQVGLETLRAKQSRGCITHHLDSWHAATLLEAVMQPLHRVISSLLGDDLPRGGQLLLDGVTQDRILGLIWQFHLPGGIETAPRRVDLLETDVQCLLGSGTAIVSTGRVVLSHSHTEAWAAHPERFNVLGAGDFRQQLETVFHHNRRVPPLEVGATHFNILRLIALDQFRRRHLPKAKNRHRDPLIQAHIFATALSIRLLPELCIQRHKLA